MFLEIPVLSVNFYLAAEISEIETGKKYYMYRI